MRAKRLEFGPAGASRTVTRSQPALMLVTTDGMPEFDGYRGKLTVPLNPALSSQFFRLRKRED